MIKQTKLGETNTDKVLSVTFNMLEKTKGIMQRDIQDSIKCSFKKGFYFGYDDIVKASRKNGIWVAEYDLSVMINKSLSNLGLSQKDLLEEGDFE